MKVDKYSYNNFVYHALNSGQSKYVTMCMKIFSNYDFLNDRYKTIPLSKLADEIFDLYNEALRFSDENTANLTKAFIKLAFTNNLNPDLIDHYFIYRQNIIFYEQFLEKAINEEILKSLLQYTDLTQIYSKKFIVKYAGKLRRQGKLNQAEKYLNDIKKAATYMEELGQQLPKIEYELGYISFLRGNQQDAVNLFKKSAEYSLGDGDIVGYWISNYVSYYYGFITGIVDKSIIKVKWREAMNFFAENATRNLNELCERWISTLNGHLFRISYIEGDINRAKKCLKEIETDSWYKKYDKRLLLAYEAKVSLLEQDFNKAVRQFEQFLNIHDIDTVKSNKTEQLAYEYQEYAKALIGLGMLNKARTSILFGLACPENCGNSYFKERLVQLFIEINKKLL